MTTTAGEQQIAATGSNRSGSFARSLVLHGAGTLLALALLPVCILLDVPLAGWWIAVAAIVGNRLVHWLVAWLVRDSSVTVVLGAMGFSMVFRALLTALLLFFVGAQVGAAGDDPIGLGRPDLARPAIVLFLLCFTLDAAVETIRRAAQRDQLAAMDPTPATTSRENPA